MKKLTSEEFIIRSQKMICHANKFYDYSFVDYKSIRSKVRIICQKHGDFYITPFSHLYGNGCLECGKIYRRTLVTNKTGNQLIPKLKIINKEKFFDYSKIIYINASTPVEIVCKYHGSFWKTPHNLLKGVGCPDCKPMSKGESLLIKILKHHNIKISNQKSFEDLKSPKGRRLRFDVILSNPNTLIEYDGKQHYNFNCFKNIIKANKSKMSETELMIKFNYLKECDRLKDDYANSNNIKLIRIRYDEDIIERLLQEGIINTTKDH